jgi:hypothetical protein
MPYPTTTDNLLDNTLTKVSQGLAINRVWANNAGTVSSNSLKLANQKPPSSHLTTIPGIFDNTFIAIMEDASSVSYDAATIIRNRIVSIVGVAITNINAAFTAGIATWSVEVVDYKLTGIPISDGAGGFTPIVSITCQINLYVA